MSRWEGVVGDVVGGKDVNVSQIVQIEVDTYHVLLLLFFFFFFFHGEDQLLILHANGDALTEVSPSHVEPSLAGMLTLSARSNINTYLRY